MRVFISYSRGESFLLADIQDILRSAGHTPWHDQDTLGGVKWEDRITHEIEICDVFVFLATRGALESEWCQREIDLAVARNKLIIPIRYDAKLTFPAVLAGREYIDFSQEISPEATAKLIGSLHHAAGGAPLPVGTAASPANVSSAVLRPQSRPQPRGCSVTLRVALLVGTMALVVSLVALGGSSLLARLNNPAVDATASPSPTLTPTPDPRPTVGVTFEACDDADARLTALNAGENPVVYVTNADVSAMQVMIACSTNSGDTVTITQIPALLLEIAELDRLTLYNVPQQRVREALHTVAFYVYGGDYLHAAAEFTDLLGSLGSATQLTDSLREQRARIRLLQANSLLYAECPYGAIRVFDKVIDDQPTWTTAFFNRGIAKFDRLFSAGDAANPISDADGCPLPWRNNDPYDTVIRTMFNGAEDDFTQAVSFAEAAGDYEMQVRSLLALANLRLLGDMLNSNDYRLALDACQAVEAAAAEHQGQISARTRAEMQLCRVALEVRRTLRASNIDSENPRLICDYPLEEDRLQILLNASRALGVDSTSLDYWEGQFNYARLEFTCYCGSGSSTPNRTQSNAMLDHLDSYHESISLRPARLQSTQWLLDDADELNRYRRPAAFSYQCLRSQ